MLNKPIVLTSSIIILSYNNESFLEESINSAKNQSRKADEIIVCDDCSNDNSIEILSKYTNEMRILKSKKNSGPLYNCLKGIKESNSDILFFLDSDDLWHPNKIEVIMSIFEENIDIMITSHKHQHINIDGQNLEIYDDTHQNMRSISESNSTFKKQSSAYKKSILLRNGGYWLGSAYAFRKSFFDISKFESITNKYPDLRVAYPDLTIAPFLVATNQEAEIAYVNKTLFYYRRHLQNATPSSPEPSDKINSIKRISKTNLLTLKILQELVKEKSINIKVINRYKKIMSEYDYLINIYSGNIYRATILFIHLFAYFIKDKKLLKEITRLFLVATIGPEKFLKLSHKKHLEMISNVKTI